MRQYTVPAPPVSPQPEAVLMIDPPPAFCMWEITSRESRKIDFTFHRHHGGPNPLR